MTDAQYQDCLHGCEGRFQKVHADDTGCDEGLRRIRDDLAKLRLYLRSRKICSGRHRQECRALKGQVTSSVARLESLIGPTPDCLEIDHEAIRKELWWLDIAHSCRGDKDYSDIHDLMAKRVRDLRRVTAMGTHYELVRTRIRRHPEYKALWPVCEGKAKPNLYYVWPLLEFMVALDSVDDLQACMETCRPATRQERVLEDLLNGLPKLEESLRKASSSLSLLREARRERLRERLGSTFPCARLNATTSKVGDLALSARTLREEAAALEAQDPPLASAVDRVARLSAQLGRGLEGLKCKEIAQACRLEEDRVVSLEIERRHMIRAVMRGGSFSVEAARRFDDLAAHGESCRWTTECRIPLRCEEDHCVGSVQLADALPLLREGERIGQQARDLAVVTARGLDSEAVKSLEALSSEQQGLQGRLEESGWSAALGAWRKAFVDDLGQQLEATTTEASEAIEGFGPDRCDRSVEPDICAAAFDGLRDVIEDLEGLQVTVGEGDPIRDPTWVRLRVDELVDLRGQVAQLRTDLGTAGAPAPQPASSSGALPVLLVGGLALLAAAAGGFISIRRRRRS